MDVIAMSKITREQSNWIRILKYQIIYNVYIYIYTNLGINPLVNKADEHMG